MCRCSQPGVRVGKRSRRPAVHRTMPGAGRVAATAPGRATMSRRLGILVGLLCLLVGPPAGAGADIGGRALFPADHPRDTPIDSLPVHPMSAQWINSIGLNTSLHPDFGTFYLGDPIGIPFTTVAGQPTVPINFVEFADESDPGPGPGTPGVPVSGMYPIPP